MKKQFFDFGTIAYKYDQWFYSPIGRIYNKLESQALNRFLPSSHSGEKMLDVGCGTGHFSELFAERGFRVYGIDISAKMVEVAQSKSIPDASFGVADMADLPFPDEYFDIAASIAALEFVEEPERMLQEMIRCIKPGGSVLIAVLNDSSPLSRKRKRRGSEIFKTAHLFTVKKLKKLLSPLNNVEVRATAFVLPWRWLVWSYPLTEFLGARLNWKWGDFIIGKGIR
ncbi:hypothetical protein AMJ80_02150 [bacterium SM23_31]|nr:MAG: hypothetical protein AMJ80_02150 [bacterium SM23_31]